MSHHPDDPLSSHEPSSPSSLASDCPTLTELGWSDRWRALAASSTDPSAVPGRVLRHDGTAVLVATGDDVAQYPIRPGTAALAVGDWLLVGRATIVELLPRASLLQRRDPSTGREQLIAANLDVVAIVWPLDRTIRPGHVQRFAALAWDAGASPVVVLTKADLCDEIEQVVATVHDATPGVEVIPVVATDGTGVPTVAALLEGRTVAFLGPSGAGKSTLVNALAGQERAATGHVRAGDRKGRHTTTARQLFVLGRSTRVIDTPGVREVGLWTDVETVDGLFEDVSDLAEGCRFHDCGHEVEPGCAVLAALGDGSLSQARYDSWQALRREAASAELRADPVAYRRADRQLGRLYREVKRLKQHRR